MPVIFKKDNSRKSIDVGINGKGGLFGGEGFSIDDLYFFIRNSFRSNTIGGVSSFVVAESRYLDPAVPVIQNSFGFGNGFFLFISLKFKKKINLFRTHMCCMLEFIVRA